MIGLSSLVALLALECLPETQMIAWRMRYLDNKMTIEQVFKTLRIEDRASFPNGSLQSVTLEVPLAEKSRLSLSFILNKKGTEYLFRQGRLLDGREKVIRRIDLGKE